MFHHLLLEWGRAEGGDRILPRSMQQRSCLETHSINAKTKHREGIRSQEMDHKKPESTLIF